jgi:hypothetical protein
VSYNYRNGYNASAVKIYNATSSLARFENKNIFSLLKKRSILLQRSTAFLSRKTYFE